MSILTFKGGVHPFDGKKFTNKKAIEEYFPTDGLFAIPLSQHIGAPATALVKPGDRVLVNQKIGEASGFISANVHSSVSGTVKMIDNRRVANGSTVSCVIIENDGLYEKMPITDDRKLEDLSREDILELIKEAGVVGMGGAGCPSHVKLNPKNKDEIDYIIVNGAECEPYLTSDHRRMIETPKIIIEGLKIALSLFDNAKGIIGIEDNKPDAIAQLKKLAANEPNIEVKALYTKYPQGGERSLIMATTKRELNSKMLPADVGCIVHNIDTIHAIYEAVVNKEPLTKRVITITGDAVKNSGNYLVPIGADIDTFIKSTGGFATEPEKIISGGPMMGMAIADTHIPVAKGTSAILCFTKDEVKHCEPSNCINCGKCVSVCPSRIIPSRLAKAATVGDEEEFIRLNGMECVECGSCSYICPAKRQVTQSIKTMKKGILAKRKK